MDISHRNKGHITQKQKTYHIQIKDIAHADRWFFCKIRVIKSLYLSNRNDFVSVSCTLNSA